MDAGVRSEGYAATFRVPGPDLGNAAYADYVAKCQAESEEPDERADWASQAFDAFMEKLVDELDTACADIRLDILDRDGTSSARMDHDRKFYGIGWGSTVEVGWRRDGADFRIAVFPTGPWREALADGHIGELAATGRSPEAFVKAHAACVGRVTDHVVAHLARSGLAVDAPVPAGRRDVLTRAARRALDVTERSVDDNLAALDGAERMEMISALREFEANGDEQPFMLLVATYDVQSDALVTFSPGEEGAPLGYHDVPEDLAALVAGLDSEEGIAALPFTKETLAWALSVSGERRAAFVVMADEYAKALDEECVVAWDGEGGRIEVLLGEATGSVATP